MADQDSVNLVYKVMFGADVTVPMLDNGNSGDGASGDGVYGATIPAQTASTLVRFKVEATNTEGTASSPSVDDSMNYHGYMVQDPSVTSNAPIINWFMDDADYADMLANHREDNVYIPSVVVYGNKVYDNSKVRIRGDLSRYEAKLSYKFKLPSGSVIQPAGANLPISEFNLKAVAKHSNLAAVAAYWWAYQQAGFDIPDVFPSRLQKNGQFEGAYFYVDKYDKEWQAANDYDDGVLYKAGEDAVASDEDGSEWVDFRNQITAFDRKDPAKTDHFLDTLDMPGLLNYMAASSSIGANDTSDQHNSLIYVNRDTNRWKYIPWDMDGTGGGKANLSPYDLDGDWGLDIVFLLGTVQQNPELRDLYLRRLRSLVDKLYAPTNNLYQRFEQVADTQLVDTNLDLNKWPVANNYGSNTITFARPSDQDYRNGILSNYFRHQKNYAGYQRIPGGLPPSQTDSERQQVSISEANYDANPANEYIKLDNAANTAVDISDWYIEGIDYTIPAGAVIPANGSIYILKADKDYRASHPSVLVAGQYSTGLGSGGGNLTIKTDSNLEIDSHAY